MTELSDKEYRALPVESFSSMKYLLGPDGPKTFLYYKNKPFKGSDASLLGTAVHHYLQGNRHLVAINNFPKIGKAGKEAYAKFEEEFKELAGDEGIIVPKSFEEKLSTIMANYNSNTKAIQLVEACEFEKPYFFKVDDIELKGKVDGVRYESQGANRVGYLLEIKTSSQATTALDFKSEAKERHYDMQAAMYLHAHFENTLQQLDHYFIVVNTIAPFKVAVYKSSSEFLEAGKKKFHEAVSRYKRYIINGEEYEAEVEHI